MKLFYNIIGTVFITMTVLFIFQGAWWQPLVCLFAAIVFYGMKDPGAEIQRRTKENTDMISAVVFRLNNGGYVTEQNFKEILNKRSDMDHGKIDY